eukprot:gene1408-1624_t
MTEVKMTWLVGEFERAAPEELAKRKIFKLKAKGPVAAKPVAAVAAVAAADKKPTEEAVAEPDEPKAEANPFAAFSFKFNTPAVAAATTKTTPTSSSTFQFSNPVQESKALSSASSSLFGAAKTGGFQFKPLETSPPTTGGFKFNTSSTTTTTALTSGSSTTSGGKWKCACCETANEETDKTCSICMVPKPVPKAGATATTTSPTSSSGSLFGGVSFGSTVSTTTLPTTGGFQFNPKPAESTSNGGFAPTTGGFQFNPSASATTSTTAPAASGGKWKCACCETANEETDKTCSICMVPKPVPKAGASTTTTTSPTSSSSSLFGGVSFGSTVSTTTLPTTGGFQFNPKPVESTSNGGFAPSTGGFAPTTGGFQFNPSASATTTSTTTAAASGGKWKCACCETANEETDKTCSICMVPKPVPKAGASTTTTSPTPSSSSLFGGATTTGSTLEMPKATGFSFKPLDSLPATTTTTGFSFNTTAAPVNLTSNGGSDKKSDGWKCACCESTNQEKDNLCQICLVPRKK